MEENKYQALTPQQYIRRLFADTKEGKLEITYYPYNGEPPYTRTYQMDWKEADAEQMVARYEALEAMLQKFGRLQAELQEEANRKALLTPEELQAWETFIRPFPPFDVEASVIEELYLRAEFDSLDEEENAVLERHWWWRQRNSLERLPFLRCSPAELILFARRHEKLIGWQAPEVVVLENGRRLAEELVLYQFGPQQVQESEEE